MTDVNVYIYDISKGIAKQFSFSLLGKQINGIWHTGIVVFNEEISFGSTGIIYNQPAGTILGNPDVKFNVGVTLKTKTELHDYLDVLSRNDFHFSKYKLLYHNCNTFSNHIGLWLTGKGIPDYITDLPQEVLDTPFGKMIQPLIDNYAPVISAAYIQTVEVNNKLKSTEIKATFFKEPLNFYVAEFLNESNSSLDFKNHNLLVELIDCVTSAKQLKFSDDLNDMIIMTMFSEYVDTHVKLIIFDVLRLLVIENEVVLQILSKVLHPFVEGFIEGTEKNDLDILKCKLICNILGKISNRQFTRKTLIIINGYALSLLRSRSYDTIATSILRNVIFHNFYLDVDVCLEVGSALIHILLEDTSLDFQSEENVMVCLCFLIREYKEIEDLAKSCDVHQKIDSKVFRNNDC